jgi:hypothetical protein
MLNDYRRQSNESMSIKQTDGVQEEQVKQPGNYMYVKCIRGDCQEHEKQEFS